MSLTRRSLLRRAGAVAAGLALPWTAVAAPRTAGRSFGARSFSGPDAEDLRRLAEWTRAVRAAGVDGVAAGAGAIRAGQETLGTPYEPHTLEAYIREGGNPSATEPLTLSLTAFDCVSLVEACLAIGRLARDGAEPRWSDFGREVERLRYRGGVREGYTSRLHYFSEWIRDNAARGWFRDLGRELGGNRDDRPLRFMTEHRDAYPGLAHDNVYRGIGAMERRQDPYARWVVPTERIPEVSDRIRTGDVLAFATAIPGLDVTHAAFAYRDAAGVLRVLHAPLSGGVVEITEATLPEYVAAISRSTGILVARPLYR